jgi:dipeptidyl aminopeptidase/acylaminoacyl peptidase
MSHSKKLLLGFASILLMLGIVGVALAIASYSWLTNRQQKINETLKESSTSLLLQKEVTPTPFPFQEMTIPYMRKKTFVSKLSDMTKYSETSIYTSYLTSYSSSDNISVNALLTIPKGDTPQKGWPAIVFVHGYIPPTLYRTTEKYGEYVDYLAKNGFVVFKMDLRGHGSSEGQAGGGYYSADYVNDTLYAYNALENASFVNKDAIGIWGHSMAGNIVTRVIASKPSIPAAVIWAGAGYTYTDLSAYRINDQSYRPPETNTYRAQERQKLREAHGDFDSASSFWREVVPTNYLADYTGAIELHHATDDTVVSIEYSRNLLKILDDTTIPHRLYEYESGGHNISGSSFSVAMKRTVEFYSQYLRGSQQ